MTVTDDHEHLNDDARTGAATATTSTATQNGPTSPAHVECDDHSPETVPAAPPPTNGNPPKIIDDAPREPAKVIPDEDEEEEGEIPDDGSDFEIETEGRTSSPQQDDEAAALNIGCGIPCRFYNHDRCTRGATCGYLHGPDDKSVRDGHGKNVCLYFLMNECKFGIPKCAYSHRKDFLPAGGWWETEEGIQEEKQRIEDEKAAIKRAAKERAQMQKQRREREAALPRRGQGKRYGQGHERHQSAGAGSSRTQSPPALPFHLPHQTHGNATVTVQELAERMQNFGFTERQLADLASIGLKPWDDGAWTALNLLYHY